MGGRKGGREEGRGGKGNRERTKEEIKRGEVESRFGYSLSAITHHRRKERKKKKERRKWRYERGRKKSMEGG